jgi:hypothetical protein
MDLQGLKPGHQSGPIAARLRQEPCHQKTLHVCYVVRGVSNRARELAAGRPGADSGVENTPSFLFRRRPHFV